MLAQKLRHRVRIDRLTHSRGANGSKREVWTQVLANEPAAIEALSGREFVAASTTQNGITHRLSIRKQPGIEPSMRVVHDELAYNIKAILPDPTMRHYLTLMCESGVIQGYFEPPAPEPQLGAAIMLDSSQILLDNLVLELET